MFTEPSLKGCRHCFPVRNTEGLARRIRQAHAGTAPLSEFLLVTPVIIRAIRAPAIKDFLSAQHLRPDCIKIDSQSVHLNCFSPGECPPLPNRWTRAGPT